MNIERFFVVLEQILNEFTFLNQHFGEKPDFTTGQYDTIFSRWKKDMYNKYRMEANLHMHWGSSSRILLENQIYLNVLHRNQYLFEIKYEFNKTPKLEPKQFLKKVESAIKIFSKFNHEFDYANNNIISQYESLFSEFKKGKLKNDGGWVYDIQWEKSIHVIVDNTLFFNILYKDDYKFQIKYFYNISTKALDYYIEELI